mgnify:CR=1 FL=1
MPGKNGKLRCKEKYSNRFIGFSGIVLHCVKWATSLFRWDKVHSRFSGIVALCNGLVFLMSTSCTSMGPSLDNGDALSLTLVQAGNVMSFVPVQIFVSRAGCRNLLPPSLDGIGPVSGDYTVGLAVLVVENRGKMPLELPWWSYRNWDVVLEPENGETKFFALHNDWRVDGPGPLDGYVYTMTLAPGAKAAFVVGVDDCGPYDAMWGKCPYPSCRMYVEYRDGGKIIRSNALSVRWRDTSHSDLLPGAFHPLEIRDGTGEWEAKEGKIGIL